jgi:hypothetical protein
MHQYRLSIERLTPEQQQQEIKDFENCGWEYIGNSNLADIHIFAVFQWKSSTKPTIPVKHGKYKVVNPLKCEGFL